MIDDRNSGTMARGTRKFQYSLCFVWLALLVKKREGVFVTSPGEGGAGNKYANRFTASNTKLTSEEENSERAPRGRESLSSKTQRSRKGSTQNSAVVCSTYSFQGLGLYTSGCFNLRHLHKEVDLT